MKRLLFTLLTLTLLLTSCKNQEKTDTAKAEKPTTSTTKNSLEIIPITHATLVLNYANETIYVDPTGGKEAFEGQKQPTLVLVTDIHGDHFDIETLKALDLKNALLVAPQAVVDKFPEDFKPTIKVMANDDIAMVNTVTIQAIPMYNLREEALKFHAKGRGNGYVLTIGEERIYISGDTEDIPEMRQLTSIDKAFVCMNLPYTMTVESAASAVLDFKPKQVYPYHYRGTEGLSDVAKFKTLVNAGNSEIEVIQLDWYPKN
ncbi:MBL fold metallo-hydrolase [Olleya namhaensis]|uniref:L-ascorbate metabolism protein UlaG, beta-lactamase superfamily n=1 Tax=Olleya namhaensis TaxID=1144750 RepID=A0A1I3M9H1_9FLAO|nr:MBL fold metallo-hydrolase [Olleya namhaensis]SFI93375.1 L-ascorbate metabolism protein UlaG, beta-lactamase superfamily [Olleya namhaensis]